jgi:hypothetical protein
MTDVPFDNLHDHSIRPAWNHVEGEQTVVLRCPNGHHLQLFSPRQSAPRHGIAEDGSVDGSVVCQGRPGDECGWHEHIRLLDWDGGTIARL